MWRGCSRRDAAASSSALLAVSIQRHISGRVAVYVDVAAGLSTCAGPLSRGRGRGAAANKVVPMHFEAPKRPHILARSGQAVSKLGIPFV